jgi:hypothetical protein
MSTLVLNLWYCIILFFKNLILVNIRKLQYSMLGGALLNLWASTITLNTKHVQTRSMRSTLHLLSQQWNGTPHELCGFVPSCGLRGFSIVFPSGYCLWLTNWVILVLLTLVPRLVWQLGTHPMINCFCQLSSAVLLILYYYFTLY